jgi:hypothetical protein
MELLYMATAHLACGFVNTVRIVEDGGVEILCHIKSLLPAHRCRLSEELINRVAAGIRNMLCIFSSHEVLVQGGCVETLVIIANIAGLPGAREDASAALRSLTYNTALRDKLLSTGAINIILDDLKRGMRGELLEINHNLLSALESESWGNGSRGAIKEGRSQFFHPLSLHLDLLRGSNHIAVNFDVKVAKLETYLVKVELDEPPIEVENFSVNKAGSIDTSDLTKFQDVDDIFDVVPMSKPRSDCPIQDHSIYALKRGVAPYPVDEDSEEEEVDNRRRESQVHRNKQSLPAIVVFTSKAGEKKPGAPYNRITKKPKSSTSSTSSLPKISSQNVSDKKFDELVAAINRSKRSNGDFMTEVSEKWKGLSRFR